MLFWLVVLSVVVCLGLAVYLEKRFCNYSGPFIVIAFLSFIVSFVMDMLKWEES